MVGVGNQRTCCSRRGPEVRCDSHAFAQQEDVGHQLHGTCVHLAALGAHEIGESRVDRGVFVAQVGKRLQHRNIVHAKFAAAGRKLNGAGVRVEFNIPGLNSYMPKIEFNLDDRWYGATAQEKAATRTSWNRRDVVLSLIVLAAVAAFYIAFW